VTLQDYLEQFRKLRELPPAMPGLGQLGEPNRIESPEKLDDDIEKGEWD